MCQCAQLCHSSRSAKGEIQAPKLCQSGAPLGLALVPEVLHRGEVRHCGSSQHLLGFETAHFPGPMVVACIGGTPGLWPWRLGLYRPQGCNLHRAMFDCDVAAAIASSILPFAGLC